MSNDASPPTNRASGRVLVVDDDGTMRALLGALLRGAGHEVELAPGGREALARAGERPPDLVLIDYMMPDMDGPAVVRLLREQRGMGDVPILLLTASDHATHVEAGRIAGADGYLRKPIDRRALIARVGEALEARAGRRP
jgi:CheY-like chemotaxis protein